MAGYFGTETQQRLQAQAEASAASIARTPGACQTVRFMGCDDPDRLGWDRIDEILDKDGICGFRMIEAGDAGAVRTRLEDRGFRLDTWDVFVVDRACAMAACEPILGAGLPNGLLQLAAPTLPEGADTVRIQAFMADAGVAPFSGSMLVGALGPAITVAIGDQVGAIVATAHAYLPHNAFSPYHRHAWVGLVAVAPSQRGRGLGTMANAIAVAGAFQKLGVTHVYELVSATNQPSRRMVAACGLDHDETRVCGIAARNESAKFTR